MNKRPFTKHPTLFLITPLLVLVLFIFVLLSQASPTAADSTTPSTNGVCVRFSLDHGRNAVTGAGVAGRYEMREVTTGGLLASWEADSQATISDWITDLPQVADGGSWVEVFFYEDGEGTAVPLQILNPAPNTPYGWVANGQCHALELQFPTNWSVNQTNSNNKNANAIGGSSTTTETAPEDTPDGNTDDPSGFQQDWASNLGTLRPITDVQVVNLNTPLTVGKMGAWQDGDKLAYGFTLINTSADHYITDVEYQITFTSADGNVSEERTVRLRDLYPLERVNIGDSFFYSNQVDYDEVEISIISADLVAIADTPIPLVWQPSVDASFSETGIWIRQQEEGNGTREDTNEAQFNFEVINPNATFIATNTTFSIRIFDDADNILGQGQGSVGDIQPLQGWELKGSIFVESPELVDNVEIVIEPEMFTPVDPTTLPTRLIQEDQISFSGQNVNIVFPGQIDFEFHLTEMLTDSGFGYVVAIAYDSDGNAIGGGAHELFGDQLVSTAQSIFLPIRASALPATVELYITYDAIDNLPPRGGGGSHPGRDI